MESHRNCTDEVVAEYRISHVHSARITWCEKIFAIKDVLNLTGSMYHPILLCCSSISIEECNTVNQP